MGGSRTHAPDRPAAGDGRFIAGISLTLGLRQVALLIVLPFVGVYATGLPGGTPMLAGVALGVYGLMQGVLQVPFGALSDRVGRKPVVLAGTALLMAGLVLAAWAPSIWWLIAGRALQGTGAINGAALAWIADRMAGTALARGMAAVSAATGLAAVGSLVAGPALFAVVSVPRVFLVCAVLTLVCGVYVAVAMPAAPRSPAGAVTASAAFAQFGIGRAATARRLVAAGFLANYVLMAVAFAVPLLLSPTLGRHLWKALVPAALAGVLAMRAVTTAAGRGHFNRVTPAAFLAFVPAALALLTGSTLLVGAGTALCMAGYLSLSALLPVAVSRVAGAAVMGQAHGAYNAGAFLGSFTGALATGALWEVRPELAVVAMLPVSLAGYTLLARRHRGAW
ncbi:MAG: MFS transporter [Vicinamibacterales bacterium]